MGAETVRKVLVIDDEHDQSQIVSYSLNLDTLWIPYPEQVIQEAVKFDPIAIILDHNFGREQTGLDFLPRLRVLFKNVPIIMLSGALEIDLAVRATQAGADDFLAKPFEPHELKVRLHVALDRYRKRTIGQSVSYLGITLHLLERRLTGPTGRQVTDLTAMDMALIAQILKNRDSITPYHVLMHEGWNRSDITKNAMQKCMAQARKHIHGVSDVITISNKYAIGYQLEPREDTKLAKSG